MPIKNRVEWATESLRNARDLEPTKRKIHRMRRLFVGDWSAITGDGGQIDPAQHLWKNDADDEWYDVQVSQYYEGQNNRLLETLKTLVQGIAYRQPQVEFKDVDPNLASLNAQYLEKRFRQNGGANHMIMALWDCIITGIGCAWLGVRGGIPVVEYRDVLDIDIDPTVRLIHDAEWVACKIRMPLWKAIDTYGDKVLKVSELDVDENQNAIVTLVEWWDVVDEGSYLTFYRHGDEFHLIQEWEEGNPFGFLPAEFMTMFELPSLHLPVGAVEQMLPAQVALMEAEATHRLATKRFLPFYEIRKGALDAEALKRFQEGEIGAIVDTDTGNDINPKVAGEPSQNLFNWIVHNEQRLVSNAGTSPYASAGVVPGTQFASEVNAIQGQAGLTAAWVARAFAEFYSNVYSKFLAIGRDFDTQPITLVFEGIEVEFSGQNPVSEFLVPEKEMVVFEDSMKFKTQEQMILESTQNLTVASQFAQIFPGMLPYELENWYRARGVQNVSSILSRGGQTPEQTMESGLEQITQQQGATPEAVQLG